MICFALQNFKINYPFLIKTPRYYMMVKSLSTSLFLLFIQLHLVWNFFQKNLNPNLHFIKIIYMNQFNRIFWMFYKKLISRKMGLYSNNLFRSHLFHLFKGLDHLPYENTKKLNLLDVDIIAYSKPVQTLNFSFHKKMYNTMIFYILNLLIENHHAHINFFKLNYSFIFFKKNFLLYPFLNNFYFKIRNN